MSSTVGLLNNWISYSS